MVFEKCVLVSSLYTLSASRNLMLLEDMHLHYCATRSGWLPSSGRRGVKFWGNVASMIHVKCTRKLLRSWKTSFVCSRARDKSLVHQRLEPEQIIYLEPSLPQRAEPTLPVSNQLHRYDT